MHSPGIRARRRPVGDRAAGATYAARRERRRAVEGPQPRACGARSTPSSPTVPPTRVGLRRDPLGAVRYAGVRARRARRRSQGLDVLDLACGTGYFSAWLAPPRCSRRRARPVRRAARHAPVAARRHVRPGRSRCCTPTREQVPLADGCIRPRAERARRCRLVRPGQWVPEAARVLRPGGRLVFLTNSLLSSLCVPAEAGPRASGCCAGSATCARVQWPGGGVEHHPSHGDWIAVLRRTRLRRRAAARDLRARWRRSTTTTTRSSARPGQHSGQPRSSGSLGWPVWTGVL